MRVSIWLFLFQQTIASAAVLVCTARFAGIRLRPLRLMTAALLSGALVIPAFAQSHLRLPGLILFVLLCAASMQGAPRRLRQSAAFAALPVLLMLTGLMRLMLALGTPLILLPAGCAALLLLRPAGASPPPCMQIRLRLGAHRVVISALTDTGNLLRDPLTGLPVIVCARKALLPLRPDALTDYPPGMRLIRVRTVSGNALMPVFRPDSLHVRTGRTWQEARAVVGLAPIDYRGCQAIVPASIPLGATTIHTQGGAV